MNTQYGSEWRDSTHSTKKNIVVSLAWGASWYSLFFFSCASLHLSPTALGSVTWSLTLVQDRKRGRGDESAVTKRKKPSIPKGINAFFGRSEVIRTPDFFVPKSYVSLLSGTAHNILCFRVFFECSLKLNSTLFSNSPTLSVGFMWSLVGFK